MVTQSTNEENRNYKKGYAPIDTIVSFLEDRLVFLEEEKKIEEKKRAAVELTENEKEDLKVKRNRIKQRKLTVLDSHIFPSMANLVVFFEYLSKHHELRQIFEDDIKELFGYIAEPEKKSFTEEQEIEDNEGNTKKVNVPYLTIYGTDNNIIRRLISSILTWNMDNDPNNFRLDLIKNIQYVIFENIVSLAMREFGGDFGVNHIINDDLGRALSWTALFGSRYSKSDQAKDDENHLPNRPILF